MLSANIWAVSQAHIISRLTYAVLSPGGDFATWVNEINYRLSSRALVKRNYLPPNQPPLHDMCCHLADLRLLLYSIVNNPHHLTLSAYPRLLNLHNYNLRKRPHNRENSLPTLNSMSDKNFINRIRFKFEHCLIV